MPTKYLALKAGLAQIPTGTKRGGLRKLLARLEAGKPVLFTGEIISQTCEYG